MLGFSYHSKGTGNKWINNEPNFDTIMITNKLPKQVSPKKQQKTLGKATQSQKHLRQPSKELKKAKARQVNARVDQQWKEGGMVKGTFDKGLHKNELAAQQRRLRAQLKKQKQLNHQQVIINEKKIGTKAIKMMRQKDDEIEYLRQMIQKQKQQKAKIDRIYEAKKEQIERQRQELLELQRRIQKEGIKERKVIQQIKKISSPQRDSRSIGGVKQSRVQQISRQYRVQQQARRVGHYQQPTQSQTLHYKNTTRQQQLDYLIHQRQQTIKGIPLINYTPTIIPLLSKASYKIISTHVSQIVELLVDQLLVEQVYVLEGIELEEMKQREESKNRLMLNEYCDMVTDFANQNDQIANKVGKYSTMNFTDIYKPKHYPQQSQKSPFYYDNPNKQSNLRRISLSQQFHQDRMQQINNRKQRFIRFVSNFDQYKKQNTDMFAKCAEEIIDEAIMKLAKQLDKGSGEFVDIVFRNQFN